MFTTTVEGNKYRIWFKHVTDLSDVVLEEKPTAPYKAVTICGMTPVEENPNESTNTVEAVAFCSVKDNFEKSIGRKVALAKLLKTLPLDKDDRREVWEIYFNKLKN